VQKKLIFDYEKSKEQQIILKSNLGAFYLYVNRKLHSSSGVGILKNAAGDMVTDGPAKATLLNDYFSSVLHMMMVIDRCSPGGCHMMLAWNILSSHQLKC